MTARAELEKDLVELAAYEPPPTPGGRVARAAGQGGISIVFIDLWRAFDWFGADTWTAEQAALRWPAVTAATTVIVAAVHNLGPRASTAALEALRAFRARRTTTSS